MNRRGMASLFATGVLLAVAAQAQAQVKDQGPPVEAPDEELLEFLIEWTGENGEIIDPFAPPLSEDEMAAAPGDDHEDSKPVSPH